MIVEFNKYEHAILKDLIEGNIKGIESEINILNEKEKHLKKMRRKLK